MPGEFVIDELEAGVTPRVTSPPYIEEETSKNSTPVNNVVQAVVEQHSSEESATTFTVHPPKANVLTSHELLETFDVRQSHQDISETRPSAVVKHVLAIGGNQPELVSSEDKAPEKEDKGQQEEPSGKPTRKLEIVTEDQNEEKHNSKPTRNRECLGASHQSEPAAATITTVVGAPEAEITASHGQKKICEVKKSQDIIETQPSANIIHEPLEVTDQHKATSSDKEVLEKEHQAEVPRKKTQKLEIITDIQKEQKNSRKTSSSRESLRDPVCHDEETLVAVVGDTSVTLTRNSRAYQEPYQSDQDKSDTGSRIPGRQNTVSKLEMPVHTSSQSTINETDQSNSDKNVRVVDGPTENQDTPPALSYNTKPRQVKTNPNHPQTFPQTTPPARSSTSNEVRNRRDGLLANIGGKNAARSNSLPKVTFDETVNANTNRLPLSHANEARTLKDQGMNPLSGTLGPYNYVKPPGKEAIFDNWGVADSGNISVLAFLHPERLDTMEALNNIADSREGKTYFQSLCDSMTMGSTIRSMANLGKNTYKIVLISQEETDHTRKYLVINAAKLFVAFYISFMDAIDKEGWREKTAKVLSKFTNHVERLDDRRQSRMSLLARRFHQRRAKEAAEEEKIELLTAANTLRVEALGLLRTLEMSEDTSGELR